MADTAQSTSGTAQSAELTDLQVADIVEQVTAELLARSQQISALEQAASLDGVVSLPAVRNGSDIVAAPLALIASALQDGVTSSLTDWLTTQLEARHKADVCAAKYLGKYAQNPSRTSYSMFAKNDKELVWFPPIDTSKATNMASMFQGCSKLTELPVLDTSKVTTMFGMFESCSSLVKIPSIDMSACTSIFYMVQFCWKLTTMTIRNLGAKYNVANDYAYNNFPRTAWGQGSEEAHQSLVDSLVTYSFDRSNALDIEHGAYPPMNIDLSAASVAVLTDEEIAAATAKGFTIVSH